MRDPSHGFRRRALTHASAGWNGVGVADTCSLDDPVAIEPSRASDATVAELRRRIDAVTAPRSAA